MSRTTWLDSASDWILGSPSSQSTGSPFSKEQTACLQKALAESFKIFATHVDARMTAIEESLHIHAHKRDNQNVATVHNDLDAAAIAIEREAASSSMWRTKKNQRRRLRRKQCKNKHVIQRSQLLCLRPTTELADIAKIGAACSPMSIPDGALDERMGKIECSLAELMTWQHSLSAWCSSRDWGLAESVANPYEHHFPNRKMHSQKH